ncbi:MAG: hypothetical protein CTY20_04005 [Hyphomicrobium sp.]|nr:MAG: hypothetical protein CTY20_04005 [Hyphomicrobium sp.]
MPDLDAFALDLAAGLWFALSVVIFHQLVNRKVFLDRSIAGAIQAQRVQWMRNMADRENRLVDTQVLQALSHGNAFFASTSAIAIGGLAALMGSGDTAQVLLERIPYVAKSPSALFEIKLVLLATIFVFAFFKFAWAFRLSHYTGIMIGATPIPTASNADECDLHARRTAALIGIAAEHANTGLRSYYYSAAALAWFFHPLLFIAATTWVLIILVRREFFSRSYRIISGQWP